MNFNAAAGGSTWLASCTRSWSVGDPCLQRWYGVSCDVTKTMVVGLSLSRCNLTGTLHGDLGQISTLKTLSLGYNALTGPLPSAWSSFSSLQSIDLTSNMLSGNLHVISQITTLASVSLSTNTFVDTLGFALPLVNLQLLSCSNNLLYGGLPQQLSTLLSLQTLFLSNNKLSGSLQALQSLPSLSVLYACSRFPANLLTFV